MGTFLAFSMGVIAFLGGLYLQGQGFLFPCLMNVLLFADQVTTSLGLTGWLSLSFARIITALPAGVLTSILWIMLFSSVRNSSLSVISAAAITAVSMISFPFFVLLEGSMELPAGVLLMMLAYLLIIHFDDKQRIVLLFGAGVALGLAGILHQPFIPAVLVLAIGYPIFTIRETGNSLAVQSILMFPLVFAALSADYLYRVYGWSGNPLSPALQPAGFWNWPWLTVGMLIIGLLLLIFLSRKRDGQWITLTIIALSWAASVIFVDKTQPGSFLAMLALGIGSIILTSQTIKLRAMISLVFIVILSGVSWIEAPMIQPINQAMKSLRTGHEVHLLADDWAVANFLVGHGPAVVDSRYNVQGIRYYLYRRGAVNQLVKSTGDESFYFNSKIRLMPVTEGPWIGQTMLYRQGRWCVVREKKH